MEKKIYYEDNWLNQHLNRVGLLNKKLSLSGVMCCVCGLELTIEENEENLTYDVRERICDKCNSELSEGRKQTQEITIKHKYCDDCGVEIKRDMACSVAKCEICGKDLCNKCIGYEANTMGDYREVYCNKCWELGTEYRLKIEQLENEIENLSTEWHNRCRS